MSDSAFCVTCGTNIGTNKFCGRCGTPVETSEETSTEGVVDSKAGGARSRPGRPGEGGGGGGGTMPSVGVTGTGVSSIWSGSTGVVRRKPQEKKVAAVEPIIEGLKKLYREKILPLETAYQFPAFHSPSFTNTDFDAKPMVMLVGQYSTGKTSFIKYLLERDFPGMRVGPEPTTDRFMAIMYGDERVVPGNAVAVQADKPFTALQKFGMAFLNRFECSQCVCPILEKISFIDTPGVLSGEKQRIGRSYDFPAAVEWFAERADRILLLFDAHKLDISDELKRVIESLAGHDDKIRCILNKADGVDKQQLMRVYGALMWSLGKVIKTPEVLRVYIGSFWDQPYQHTENAELFEAEERDLLADLRSLPRNSAVRKINELVKRARMLKVHVIILDHLRNQFGWFGKNKTQEKLLTGLLEEFKKIQTKYALPMGDFPHVGKFRDKLKEFPINKFPKLEQKLIDAMDTVLSVDIPKLMKLLPSADEKSDDYEAGGIVQNPFIVDQSKADVGGSWAIDGPRKKQYDNTFFSLEVTNGKLSGAKARDVLLASRLGPDVLRQIWDLSDLDTDGNLDSDEFAVAMFLIDSLNSGIIQTLPASLPPAVVPPSKRHLFDFGSSGATPSS